MAWQHYRLSFRLLSPLHIGYRKVGNLMQTRPYVPGKVLWAALTARLVRNAKHGAKRSDYQEVEEQLRQHFRFGYLWPSLDGEDLYLPWEYEDFDYLLLGSYASTALDHVRHAALEGQLRETEFLAPVARTGETVYLLGDLWVQEDNLPAEVRRWKDVLRFLMLGGARGYGWGRVKLAFLLNDGTAGEKTIAGYTWEDANGQVLVHLPKDQRLTAHALAAGEQAVTGVEGPVEPRGGWERREDGYRLARDVRIAYEPGARVTREGEFIVDPWGCLKQGGTSTGK